MEAVAIGEFFHKIVTLICDRIHGIVPALRPS